MATGYVELSWPISFPAKSSSFEKTSLATFILTILLESQDEVVLGSSDAPN